MHDCPNRSFRHMQPAVFQNFINMMKRIFFSCLLALLVSVNLQANEDTRAQSILSKAATAYQKSGGISIRFGGSQQGTLALKGTCFYLECGGVKSWFDGTTQWSYVEQNEEVTVSTPSPDELQSINPYALINSYNRLFHCRYGGKHTIRGKEGNEIILTPRQKGDIESVVLFLSENYQPLYITVKLASGQIQEFRILDYQTGMSYTNDTFRFDAKKYPQAEVIDMR